MKLPFYDKFCVLDGGGGCLRVQSLLPGLLGDASANCSAEADLPAQADLNTRLELLAKSQPDVLADLLAADTPLDVFPIRAAAFRSYMLISWAVYENSLFGEHLPMTTPSPAKSLMVAFCQACPIPRRTTRRRSWGPSCGRSRGEGSRRPRERWPSTTTTPSSTTTASKSKSST